MTKKCQIDIKIQLSPDREAEFMQIITTFLTNQKNANKIDYAELSSKEIEIMTIVRI